MATNGQVKTNTEYESYFWVKWEQVGNQDIANNRTQIKWTCGFYSEHNFAKNAVKMSAVTINGTQVYSGGTYSNMYDEEPNHTLATGTLWINHNTDGTKTFTISAFTGWLYSNHNYSAAAKSFTLTTIPRKATITAASDFTDVANPSISFNNPGGFTMDVWLEPNPVGDHLCIRKSIPNTGKYTWTLTEEEREQLRSKCAGKECTIRLGLYTYIGSTTHSDYKDQKFTMTDNPATKPDVTMIVSLNNSLLPSKFDGLYVQGKSKVDVELSAEGKYGATIDSYSAEVDGKTYNSDKFTSDVIQTPGSQKVVGYAKDSREFTGSAEEPINVIEYSKPLVTVLSSENAIQCYRSDGNGNRVGNSTSLWIKAGRSYYSVSGKNQCRLQWRWKPIAVAWDDNEHKWNDLLTSDAATDEYNAQVPGEFYLKDAYSVQIRAIDDIGEYDIKPFEIPTQDVALHLGKGGKNVSVGTYCDYSEERTFYSDWKAIFDKTVVVGGDLYIGEKNLREYILDVINEGG